MPSCSINNKPLFYIDEAASSPTATTTLLIHGLGSSSCFYKPIIPILKSRTRCIALDTPGSGLSTLGTSEQNIASIVKDAIALLDALNVQEKVIVVGHSMGGIVASELAASYPERVRGVVLLGPVNPNPSIAEVFAQRIQTVEKSGVEALANTVPTAATGHKAGPLHHAFIRALILGTSNEGYISLCQVIARATQPDYVKAKVPLLILAGAEDKSAPLAGCQAIHEAYGTVQERKRIQILQGVGHWHCVEAGDEVGNLILEFLKEVS